MKSVTTAVILKEIAKCRTEIRIIKADYREAVHNLREWRKRDIESGRNKDIAECRMNEGIYEEQNMRDESIRYYQIRIDTLKNLLTLAQ